MNGRFQNPYSQLGTSAAGIVDTFLNRDAIKGKGYLDASKSMADIENTRASTAKILQELARQQEIDQMGPEMLAPGVSQEDWDMQRRFQKEGNYGTMPYQPDAGEVFPGEALPPGLANVITDRPASLTDADISSMDRASQVDAILKRTGGSGQGFNSIMEALQGPMGGLGGFDDNTTGFIKDNLPIAVRGYALQHLNQNPGDIMGALTVALAKADEASYNEIMRMFSQIPLSQLGIMTEDDPNKAMQGIAQRARELRRYLANPNYQPPGQSSGGVDYNYVPGQGLVQP